LTKIVVLGIVLLLAAIIGGTSSTPDVFSQLGGARAGTAVSLAGGRTAQEFNPNC
jgi:hypothetical protein